MSLHAVRVYRGFVVLWHWRNINVMFICIQFSMWPSICRSGVQACLCVCTRVPVLPTDDTPMTNLTSCWNFELRVDVVAATARVGWLLEKWFIFYCKTELSRRVVVVIELNVFQHLRTIFKEFSSTFFHFLLLVACAPCDSLAANQKIRKFSVRITWMTFRTIAGHSRSGQTVRICCRIVYA